MTIIFPKNNLPEPAQPWAREVQKQLSNVVASDRSNEINNSARDNQLNSSLISLTKVVSDVKTASDKSTEALNGLLGLGSSGSDYTLNASNIVGGTITGVTFNTSGSAESLSLSSGEILFFAGSSLVARAKGESGVFVLDNNQTGTGSGIAIGSVGASLFGRGASVSCGNPGSNRIEILATAGLDFYGSTGSVNIASTGTIRTDGSLIRNALAGEGTTGASFNNNGSLVRTSSSERYKQDIEDLTVQYEDLLLLQPRRFRLKDEALEDSNARYYAGFIAEEVDQTSLKDFVSYKKLEDGTRQPDGVYYGELTAALLEAIKHQDQLIKSLTSRIEALESKVE